MPGNAPRSTRSKQGTVRAVEVGAGWFELEVEPGYPTPDAENFVKAIEPFGKWGMIMDRTTRRIRSGTPCAYGAVA